MGDLSSNNIVDLPSLKQACKSCSLHDLCLPMGIPEHDLSHLEHIVKPRRPLQRGEHLYRPGDNLASVYAVRAGSIKTYTLTDDGQEQVIGFHLPGEVLGLDAICDDVHPCAARALETTSVCELPFERLAEIAAEIPGLQHQLYRLMSRSLRSDEHFMTLLGKKASDQRLAAFLLGLSQRFSDRGYSRLEFNLSMSRSDIANYLGLAVETVSRLFTRFQSADIIDVNRKLVTIKDPVALEILAGLHDSEPAKSARP